MKITDNVYSLNSTRGTYAYIILGKEIILVDSGLSFQRKGLLKELKSMNISLGDIKHILLTHHDLDHIGNAAVLQELSGAQIWVSKEDIPYISGEKKRSGIKRILSSLFMVQKPKDIRIYDYTQKIGDVEIIPTPGHTPGHVCLLYNSVLFSGDLIETPKGRIMPHLNPLMTWDGTALLESIKKLAPLPFKWVCPAHGKPLERGGMWEKMI